MGNIASESVIDTEAVQKVMESILKTTAELNKVEICLKLIYCRKVRIREYQQQGF